MEINKVKQLVEILEQSNIAVLELSDVTGTVKLAKTAMMSAPSHHGMPMAAPQVASVPQATAPQTSAPETTETITATEGAAEEVVGEVVKSPLVGTFYAKPSPEAQAFVEVGATVKKGQVICIIEAMKVMNEIKAPVAGTIGQIFVETGDMVEFDTPLVTIVTA